MKFALLACQALSGVAFLFYGGLCLYSESMVREFERFGLARLRRLTGILEVLGGLGLLAGYLFPPLVTVSSAGLTLLMLMGLLVRARIKDSPLAMLPALTLLVVNAFLFVQSLG